jgi:uncharacterized protein (TIGR02145 family)
MSILCKLGSHSWEGCKCSKCGKTRDENHSWEGITCVKCGKIKDIDGNTYKAVKIGTQAWMVENLNIGQFRNGDEIWEAKTAQEWEIAGQNSIPAWCYYDNDPENGKKYGRLYNWYAVNDKRGLAPTGFHIPTEVELQRLGNAVNNNSNALKAIGQGAGIGAGTNTSGFSALLAGGRYLIGFFGSLGDYTNFWSSTGDRTIDAFLMGFDDRGSNIHYNIVVDKVSGFSVRCLKD